MNELGTGKEREVAALVATPGLSLLVTIGTGPIRGMHTGTNGTLYVVSAGKIYSVSSLWVATELGSLTTVAGPVSMADNGTTLMAVDGTSGYIVTLSSGAFAQITDPDFPGADQVTYQDGYFIFNVPDTGQFMITGLNAVTVDALDIATSEGAPDDIVAVMSDHRELWLFNERTIEVFFDSGNADFPFERIQGAFIEHGCGAPFSVAKMNNAVFWVGSDDKGSGIVYMASGYQPQRISTHAVEQAIRGYGDISSTTSFTYQSGGHFFYQLNFPNAQSSWVYDSTSGMWHERVFTNQGAFERHRAECHAFAYAKHIVGDYVNGKVYELSSTAYSDDSSEITRQRITPHATSALSRMFYNSFQLDIEAGTGLDGLSTTQGTDPQAMLQWSDDGGHSWSNEKWVAFGKIGQTKKRSIWRRLGSSRDRVFKLTITDPVKVTLIGVELGLEQAAS